MTQHQRMWGVSPKSDTNNDLWFVTNRERGKGQFNRHDKLSREENRGM
jgi:hypothetical protein